METYFGIKTQHSPEDRARNQYPNQLMTALGSELNAYERHVFHEALRGTREKAGGWTYTPLCSQRVLPVPNGCTVNGRIARLYFF